MDNYYVPKIEFTPKAAEGHWDATEVDPVRQVMVDGKVIACEVCNEGEEEFWSVYLHQREGGVQCVADVPTKKQAEDLAELIESAAESYRAAAKGSPRELLTEAVKVLNAVPNRNYMSLKYVDTYKLASAIEDYLRK